jgi:clan AA aspartic protease
MGLVYADIELMSVFDIISAKRHIIGEEEIKRINVTMLVDTGCMYLCINENIREFLQLETLYRKKGVLANGEIVEYDIVGGIDVRFQNRRCQIDAMVLPEGNELLLGVIPMEAMDVLINPVRQELVVNPESPDMALLKLKGVRPLPQRRA